MPALPKPPPCHQDWLAMQPTQNGRLCGQCEKEIYDFSAMSWQAIVQTQAAHGNALCGMYSPAQLKHWGQPPPSACAQLAAATTLALALAAIPAPAQTVVAPSAGLVLRGTVSTAAPSLVGPLPGVTVLVAGTIIGTNTDMNGQYELAIPDTLSRKGEVTVRFSNVGFVQNDFVLPPQSHGVLQHDAILTESPAIVYSVLVPTFSQRLRWSFKRLFSRKD